MFIEKVVNQSNPNLTINQLNFNEIKIDSDNFTHISKVEKSLETLDKILTLRPDLTFKQSMKIKDQSLDQISSSIFQLIFVLVILFILKKEQKNQP